MLRKMICFALTCACVATVSAQYSRNRNRTGRNAQSEAEAAQDKMDSKVRIVQMPSIGLQSLIVAPALSAQGGLQQITKSRRQWGVFDMTYYTQQRWTEEIGRAHV